VPKVTGRAQGEKTALEAVERWLFLEKKPICIEASVKAEVKTI
jgi:hypothetical protein